MPHLKQLSLTTHPPPYLCYFKEFILCSLSHLSFSNPLPSCQGHCGPALIQNPRGNPSSDHTVPFCIIWRSWPFAPVGNNLHPPGFPLTSSYLLYPTTLIQATISCLEYFNSLLSGLSTCTIVKLPCGSNMVFIKYKSWYHSPAGNTSKTFHPIQNKIQNPHRILCDQAHGCLSYLFAFNFHLIDWLHSYRVW